MPPYLSPGQDTKPPYLPLDTKPNISTQPCTGETCEGSPRARISPPVMS